MLKIGEFSKLTHVSIRMLRHYDMLGLLKPVSVDPESGYRYYSAQQLPRLNRILALQELGFSLEQVGRLLDADLSVEQMKGMLLQKQAELEDRLREEAARLARVAARLQQIEHEDEPSPYDVRLRQVDAQWVASVRGVIPGPGAIGMLFGELFARVPPSAAQGLALAIWHDAMEDETRVDGEAALVLAEPVPAVPGLQVYTLPAAQVVSVVHHGAFRTLDRAYQAVLWWMEQQGLHTEGAYRELYLHYTLPSREDDESYVTELQFPVSV